MMMKKTTSLEKRKDIANENDLMCSGNTSIGLFWMF